MMQLVERMEVATDKIYGADQRIQRCRNYKLRTVLGHRPKADHDQVKAVIRGAWKLEVKEGETKLEHLAPWLERDHPSGVAITQEPGRGPGG